MLERWDVNDLGKTASFTSIVSPSVSLYVILMQDFVKVAFCVNTPLDLKSAFVTVSKC